MALSVLWVYLLAGAASAQTALVEWRELVVPGACTLRFAVPQGWSTQVRSPLEGAVNVRISPESGSGAEVLITGLAPKGDGSLKTTGDIKRAAREMGEEMLPGSVEKRIELERVDGTAGSGFFYTLTDKRPSLPEGEFRHMVQGIMSVGPLRLAVTMLADKADSPAKAMTFDLLRTAECAVPQPEFRK